MVRSSWARSSWVQSSSLSFSASPNRGLAVAQGRERSGERTRKLFPSFFQTLFRLAGGEGGFLVELFVAEDGLLLEEERLESADLGEEGSADGGG